MPPSVCARISLIPIGTASPRRRGRRAESPAASSTSCAPGIWQSAASCRPAVAAGTRREVQNPNLLQRSFEALPTSPKTKTYGGGDHERDRQGTIDATIDATIHCGAGRAPAAIVVAREDAHHHWDRNVLRRLRRVGDRRDLAGLGGAVEAQPEPDRVDHLGRLCRPDRGRAVLWLVRGALRPREGVDLLYFDSVAPQPGLRPCLGL